MLFSVSDAAASTVSEPLAISQGAIPCFDCEGAEIDEIVINNRNIYDLNDPRYDNFLFGLANRLHVVTRERVVRQELLLVVGDEYSFDLAEETARNLRTRFPLNEAWVWPERDSSGRVILHVETVDQWSLVGGLRSVDRDGQETDYQIGIEERNLLGGAQFLSFDFFARENDPNYVEFLFREPRIAGRSWALSCGVRDDPDDTRRFAHISHPYYELDQSDRFSVQWINRNRLNERYDTDGALSSRWHTKGQWLQVEYGHRWGPRTRKLELAGEYQYGHRRIVGEIESFDGDEEFLPNATDSIYHFFTAGATWKTQRFIVEKRIRGFEYTEDFELGFDLNGRYGRAFRPGFGDYYYDFLSGRIGFREQSGNTLIGAEYERSIWFRGDEESRRTTSFSVTLYNNRLRYLTWAVRSFYMADRGGQDRRLVIGGKSGLRGYPTELMAGDRLHVINVEGRFFPGLELLSVKIGAAVFTDLGRTWQRGESLNIEGYRISAGVGLRLSLEALRKGEIVRVDASAIEGGGIELSFGTGQYF